MNKWRFCNEAEGNHVVEIVEKFKDVADRISCIQKTTGKPITDILRWMYEKKYVYRLDEKVVAKMHKSGGGELWGIIGKTACIQLYSLVRAMRPDSIVETGVMSGLSSYVFLQAMEKNMKGKLYSIDYVEPWGEELKKTGKESGWLVPSNLRYRWKPLIGKSSDLLPVLLNKIKPIDIFFHDSEHTYECMWFEFNLVWDYLRKGGMLLSHDINWNNAFIDFSKKVNVKPNILGECIGLIRKT
jgi:predicted O-methyltransferase YrrM